MAILLLVTLSGPLFYCVCRGQVVTLPQLKPQNECCTKLNRCGSEPEAPPSERSASNSTPGAESPCGGEIEVAFATPKMTEWRLLDVVSSPSVAAPALAEAFRSATLPAHPIAAVHDYRGLHPPSRSHRLHLHWNVFLI